jgi:hypothetical protein
MTWTRSLSEYKDIQTAIDRDYKRFTSASLSVMNIGYDEYMTIKRDCNKVRYMDIESKHPDINHIVITGNIYKLASEMNEVAYRDNNESYAKACDVLVDAMQNKRNKVYDVIKQNFRV